MDEDYELSELLSDEQKCLEDYFDDHADEMYEKYVEKKYDKIDNQFVCVYNTSTVREYIIPGTNIHKTEIIDNDKVKSTIYYKKGKLK